MNSKTDSSVFLTTGQSKQPRI